MQIFQRYARKIFMAFIDPEFEGFGCVFSDAVDSLDIAAAGASPGTHVAYNTF